jgi:protein-disulfide isomerase
MLFHRRSLLGVVGGLVATRALAQAADPRMGERSFGHADAPAVVTEFFSLTCTHCAAFSREVMPQITKDLIDTGKLRIVYRDFPLDQVALTAAMVARALPPERYEPFIATLFASQDRWAFARGVNSTDELAKMAALAGLSRPVFDATIADQGLRNAILAAQQQAETQYKINSTPTFLANGKTHPGAMALPEFTAFATASG